MKIIDKAIEIAQWLVGAKEEPKDSNRGRDIDVIQGAFGFSGVQYCVLFCLYCYKIALGHFNIEYTLPNTASSQTLFEEAKKLGCVSTDFTNIQPGDIVIWRKFKLWQGHAGLCVSYLNTTDNSFVTIEGNTQPDNKGDQREGGGIYKKVRYAKKVDFLVDNFYLRGYIQMDKLLKQKGY